MKEPGRDFGEGAAGASGVVVQGRRENCRTKPFWGGGWLKTRRIGADEGTRAGFGGKGGLGVWLRWVRGTPPRELPNEANLGRWGLKTGRIGAGEGTHVGFEEGGRPGRWWLWVVRGTPRELPNEANLGGGRLKAKQMAAGEGTRLVVAMGEVVLATVARRAAGCRSENRNEAISGRGWGENKADVHWGGSRGRRQSGRGRVPLRLGRRG